MSHLSVCRISLFILFSVLLRPHPLFLSLFLSLSHSPPIITKWLPGSHASSSYLDSRTQKGKTDRRALDLTKEQRTNKWMNQRKTARTYNSPEPGALPLVFFFTTPSSILSLFKREIALRPPPTTISLFSLSYLLLLALSFLSLSPSLPFVPLSILTLRISSLCVGSMIEL